MFLFNEAYTLQDACLFQDAFSWDFPGAGRPTMGWLAGAVYGSWFFGGGRGCSGVRL